MTDMQIQPRSSGSAGDKVYWRSLDQLADTPEFQDVLRREFAVGADEGPFADGSLADPVSRRRFLGVVAASVAMAGMTSCRKPGREILPYAKRPEGLVPGIPNFYATSFERHGYGLGVLVRSSDGRPTKVEGNPDHPGSQGGVDSFAQAEVLNLFDPARSKWVRTPHEAEGHDDGDHSHDGHDHDGHGDEHAHHHTLADFRSFWGEHALKLAGNEGAGLHVLMAPTASPTVARMVAEARSALPKIQVHTWSALVRDHEVAGSKLAFGEAFDTHHDFAKAKVVAAFDSDFLGTDATSLAQTRSWAKGRKIVDRDGSVSRLYVVEPTYTLTGSNADHRFRLSGAEIGSAVFALAAALGVPGMDAAAKAHTAGSFEKNGKNWLAAVAKDLRAANGEACVVVGPRQSAAVHAAAHAINAHLGATGKTVTYTRTPAALAGDTLASVRALVDAMNAGQVDTLVCLGTNPVLDAPADLGFADAYAKVAHRVHCGMWIDETAKVSSWHIPMSHPLEHWSDTVAADGTAAIVQPLIDRLYPNTRSAAEILSELLTEPKEGDALVRATWQTRKPSGMPFETFWQKALHDGLIAGTAQDAATPTLAASAIAAAISATPVAATPTKQSIEVGFRACPTLLDGRYSNNPWQQELPSPIEKLVWDNAVLMCRSTADALGVYNSDVVQVKVGDRTVEGPVWIQPGHAENAVTVWFGYGRKMSSECAVAEIPGFDAYPLRGSDAPHYAAGATVTKTGRTHTLVSSQEHGVMEGRPLVRENDLATFKADTQWTAVDASPLAKAAKLQGKTESQLMHSLWTERDYSQGYQWAMVIDLNTCTGCNACVTACVSENNIPMVGKEQIANGREMFWNRMDRYFTGAATQDGVPLDDDPQVVHQMVPCMQCENAPCESVCPVAATVHSPEGLNDMAYNRCIGTRYCSNNCPYKVRRFNWFNFNKDHSPQRQMAFNPDVTIRARGVMEKCTYCVQRINSGKLAAKVDGRTVRDGDIRTACQQACPADAITFGNINDPEAAVTKLRGTVDRKTGDLVTAGSPLHYAMLSELNVKPRTTYLAKIRNPNPELS